MANRKQFRMKTKLLVILDLSLIKWHLISAIAQRTLSKSVYLQRFRFPASSGENAKCFHNYIHVSWKFAGQSSASSENNVLAK